MIEIINGSLESFFTEVKYKKLFVFGAGRRLIHLCETIGIADKIIAVIDNNTELWDTVVEVKNKKLPIINVEKFIKSIEKDTLKDIVLLITPAFYAWKIVEQLDAEKQLNGLRCYISSLLMEYYVKQKFSFTDGRAKIPKKIHYCWFGEAEIPDKLKKCIDSWRKMCPDYEIIRWDENNYDITKNLYMKQAYECKKWGFVPDYARLDIIYREGGIYLDTDVELVRSLDLLLCDEMFCCADSNTTINFGTGFGAVQGNNLIKQMRDYYDDKVFINADGSLNVQPCYMYQNPILEKHGFTIKNEYQKKNGCVIYPSEVAAPTGLRGMENNFTEKTVSVHHSELSWISEDEKENLKQYKMKIMDRI